MKNRTKRILSALLTLALFFTSFVFVSTADTVEGISVKTNSEFQVSYDVCLYPSYMSEESILADIAENESQGALYTAECTSSERAPSPQNYIRNYRFPAVKRGNYRLVVSYDAVTSDNKPVYRIIENRAVTVTASTVSFDDVLLPAPSDSKTGDVNKDSKINLKDVVTVMRFSAKWDIEIYLPNADITHDGKVNVSDASLIMKYCAGWPPYKDINPR